jgi:signal transduction histidine kinase
MQQIVLNLINNAVKFTPDGFVRVETREVGSMVEVAVIDSGIGIPGDELANLFDEFRQVDGTSTREYGGTGLGLAISQKFAMQLGGQLTVTSTLGEGSRFVLALPLSLPGADAWSDPVETDSVPVALDTSGFADDDWSD